MKRIICLSLIAVLVPALEAAPKRQRPSKAATRTRLREPEVTENRILRAQVLLDRSGISAGEIDGKPGDNLRRAIMGFQKKNGLTSSGELDQPTWTALNTDTAKIVVEHTISAEEVSGPYVEQIPTDMMEQSKLKALSYTNPQEELGEKFHCSPALLAKLNPGKDLTKAGEVIQVPNVRTAIAGKAASVVVSKSAITVTALDGEGKILAQYPATIGSEHDPLPIGDWKVTGVGKNPIFHYNPELFWDADATHAKADIPAGPNNPVGVVWIGLTKEHYGIHGTPNPGTVGHAESHGCVRLTNWDAMELAGMVSKGTLLHFIE